LSNFDVVGPPDLSLLVFLFGGRTSGDFVPIQWSATIIFRLLVLCSVPKFLLGRGQFCLADYISKGCAPQKLLSQLSSVHAYSWKNWSATGSAAGLELLLFE